MLVTGHLFAQGGSLSGSERSKPESIGLLGQIPVSCFGDSFDYVALGHLHKHQIVGGHEHIRYSGSPIPLSFSEVDYGHQVLLLDFETAGRPLITSLLVPCTRKLLRVRGRLDEVLGTLRAWTNKDYSYTAWAEVTVVGETSAIHINDELDKLNGELQEKVAVISRRIQANVSITSPENSPPSTESIHLSRFRSIKGPASMCAEIGERRFLSIKYHVV